MPPQKRKPADLAAQLRGFQRIGVTRVVIHTMRDNRVCEACEALEGQRVPLAEALAKVLLPVHGCTGGDARPGHEHYCRCFYEADLADFWK